MEKGDKKYKLDKTAFQAMSVEEADSHYGEWKNRSYKERFEAGCYLVQQFYGITPQTPVDKTVFTKRKHQHRQ